MDHFLNITMEEWVFNIRFEEGPTLWPTIANKVQTIVILAMGTNVSW